jgi:hypothetical protein
MSAEAVAEAEGVRDSVLVTDAVGVGGVPVGVTDTELVEVGL